MHTQTLPTERKTLSEALENITPDELFKMTDHLFNEIPVHDCINLMFELAMTAAEKGYGEKHLGDIHYVHSFFREIQVKAAERKAEQAATLRKLKQG
jgi:hypothetical protein